MSRPTFMPKRLGGALTLSCLLMLSASGTYASTTNALSQISDPLGFISSNSCHANGSLVSTVNAPIAPSGYRFTHWTITGGRINDHVGRAVNPASFTITADTEAVANYLGTSIDADSDSVPDWFELLFYNTTNQPAFSDTDGDGLSLQAEYNLDLHPNIRDDINTGGVARRRSLLIPVILDTNWFLYKENSEPAGFIDTTRLVSNRTVVVTPSLWGAANDYAFAFWTVNGDRMTNAVGQAVCQITISVTNTTTATAHYIRQNQDDDGDSLPDWYEWHYWGSLTYGPTNDPEGDGLAIQAEYERDLHPLLADTIQLGGISRRRSLPFPVSQTGYFQYVLNSDPPGFTSESGFVTGGTWIATASLYGETQGYSFTHWTVNGVRQTNELGASRNAVQFQVLQTTTGTAHYVASDLDADSDGVRDWYELYYYGNTNASSDSDSDCDGADMLREFSCDLNPLIRDTTTQGGIAARRSLRIFFCFNDLDADEIPNSWELLHFGGVTNANPSADVDSDGMPNIDEYIAGTDPTNSSDRFVCWISEPAPLQGGFVVKWMSANGRIYTVLTKSNLRLADWDPIYQTPGTGQEQSYTNTDNATPTKFFRIDVRMGP